MCCHCMGIVKKIKIFYTILEKEMAKPCAPKIVTFTESIIKSV